MEKLSLIIFLTVISSVACNAQKEKLYWPNGGEVMEGDTVQLGEAKDKDRVYTYVHTKVPGHFKASKIILMSNKGALCVVKKIKKEDIELDMFKYQETLLCEFQDALKNGEIKKYRR